MAGTRRMRAPRFAIIATSVSMFLAALNASAPGPVGPQGGPGETAYLPTSQTLVNGTQPGGNCGTVSWSDVRYSDDLRCAYSDADDDPDLDGIPNVKELQFVWAGADPNVRDLFIEVDYMGKGAEDDPPHRPPTEVKNHLISIYAAHGIRVHIDDGSEGFDLSTQDNHAQEISHLPNGRVSFNTVKVMRGQDAFFAASRRGVFHYAVYAHFSPDDDLPGGGADAPGDVLVIWDGGLTISRASLQAASFLVHELGHNVLGRYCNDPEPIEETCFGYPSRIYNDNMAHFNQANTPADLNDVDLDDVDDQYVHFSGDVMCGAGFACDIPPGSEYDYGAATWVAVQLWRSFPP